MNNLTKSEKIESLKNWFSKTKVDAEVVDKTLGISSASLNPNLLLASTAKLVKVNKQEIEPDDRDNLRFSTFLGIEDYMKEHVEKDAGKIQLKAKQKMEQKKDLSWLHAGFFTPQIRSVVVGNSLSQNIEGINPIETYDTSHKVSKLGDGGISNTSAIPDESRAVNSSQFGLMDPFHMAESISIGVVNYFTNGVRKSNDGKLIRLMLNKEKEPVWVAHDKLLNSKLHIPEY